MEQLSIRGARIHNLKNIDLDIPKQQLIVITGISGSGKSSLAFDIIFEEGKNQYLSSIGILAGLDNEDRFDSLKGIGPTVSVRQNTVRQSNPRSTVGSKMNILNQLALIYASDGKTADGESEYLSPSDFLYTTADGMCEQCQGRGSYYDIHLEPLIAGKEMTLYELFQKFKLSSGFMRLYQRKFGTYFDVPFCNLPDDIREQVMYGTFENGKQTCCIERILHSAMEKGEDVSELYVKITCPECHGERVSDSARNIYLHGKRIGELGQMTLTELLCFLTELSGEELSQFSKNVVRSLITRLNHLISFRLGHLTLYRELSTLSGGELQRLFLHLHLTSGLDSLIYVFDEPMAGLHVSEKETIIQAIEELKALGNTVIVVEHDKEMIKHADHIIEIGPKAGTTGGNVVFQGSYKEYRMSDTLLSRYVSGQSNMPQRNERKTVFDSTDRFYLTHANLHYLKDVSVSIPLHAMVGIAGRSGSGKSSLIMDTLLKRLTTAKKYDSASGLEGWELIDGFATISQEPIGRSSSSTPASYIGIWDKIRDLFAVQDKAKERGMTAGDFSFHSKGACPECNGSGYERIFLTSDFSVDKICPCCHGTRYQENSLKITYHDKTIVDVLDMSITEAISFFADQVRISRPLMILEQMGMGYLILGQPTSSLSGGEAQRIKLAKELGKQRSKNMLYVMDEPTTGLSLYDTSLLLKLLDELVSSGNSVIVIEHNINVLRNCDYVIELGPEGGEQGGEIIATGTPEELSKNPNSKTGRYLA